MFLSWSFYLWEFFKCSNFSISKELKNKRNKFIDSNFPSKYLSRFLPLTNKLLAKVGDSELSLFLLQFSILYSSVEYLHWLSNCNGFFSRWSHDFHYFLKFYLWHKSFSCTQDLNSQLSIWHTTWITKEVSNSSPKFVIIVLATSNISLLRSGTTICTGSHTRNFRVILSNS